MLALIALPGCGPGGPISTRLRADVQRPDPAIVIFFVDGLPPQLVEEGCRDGWLPNIKKRFRGGGAHAQRMVTCVPSITYAATSTLLTGVRPPTHGVIGNRWFDPGAALFRSYVTIENYRDINEDVRGLTLYEHIQPDTSANIQTALTRGVTKSIANWAVSGVMWHFRDYTAVDKLSVTSLGSVANWANRRRQWPTVLMCYMPAIDTVAHHFGVSGDRFVRGMEHVDYQIGRACDWLERESLLETTYIILLSDHGMVDVDPNGHIDLVRLVREDWGGNATSHMLQNDPLVYRRGYYDRYSIVVDYRDGRRASLHLRGESGWHEPPPPEVVEAILTKPPEDARIWNIPGVALAAYLASDDEAVLRDPTGMSRVLARQGVDGPEYAYAPEPDDVLRYTDDPDLAAFVSAGFHRPADWLQATVDQETPDLVPHIIALLHMRTAGQLIVFAEPGYSFKDERGGHGGIHRTEMLMTFMIAGPGIMPGTTIDLARAEDILPTLLELLGREPVGDARLEGHSFAGQLLDATRHRKASIAK